VDTGEECDQGAANGATTPGACGATCKNVKCDGKKCDEGTDAGTDPASHPAPGTTTTTASCSCRLGAGASGPSRAGLLLGAGLVLYGRRRVRRRSSVK
jgi:MYXO-CTERM domain-containing protein